MITFKNLHIALVCAAGLFTTLNAAVIRITSVAQFDYIIQSQHKVLVDFYSPYCGPCMRMGPLFDEVASNVAFADVTFLKVSIITHELNALVQRYNIRSVPTIIGFADGSTALRYSGFKTIPQLHTIVAELQAK